MSAATAETSEVASRPAPSLRGFLGLALGSAGVVYGDIGTSPLYAFRESISHVARVGGRVAQGDVIGVISLMLWTLMVIVTLKYVWILMRFDNRGEGGTLSLMALVQKAGGRASGTILVIGMIGAGMFFGDAILTPAISVLSAVEGLKVVHGLGGRIDPLVVPLALAVLVALFVVQKRGTGGIGRWFGPICVAWFATIAVLGLMSLTRAPQVLGALNPLPGLELLAHYPTIAPEILGSVFLTVTGAEALYADMGHFGRGPIQWTWGALVFPCLIANYLGQGALVLADPSALENPFFHLAPAWFQLPLVILATAATVIASQAVISGAFSMTQQAIQLGLLPRLTLKPTSESQVGQIYAPQINWILLPGVAALVLGFRSSDGLANAYGVSVVGAMITSSILAVVAIHRLQRRPIWQAVLAFSPFLAIEAAFLVANLTKVAHGGYIPLLIASALIFLMWTWMRGVARVSRAEQSNLTLADVLPMLTQRPPLRARGVAVFLTADPTSVPAALMHNLKHNQVLHEQIVLLTVKVARRPRVPDAERVEVSDLAPGFKGMTLWFGYMETPNVAKGMALARAKGLKFDIMRTSFFLSRRTLLPRRRAGLGHLADVLFVFLARNAVRTADFFQIPPSRVVELGAQVAF
ncbi:potassium transporter Kup [Phenylobacterium sp.]|jgi:KUP system potassium uptake protein|uniref:potassium transporter Kup n=1 Tax=Phenylobacterium sp. TaxID=1871053 RepID=UPI002E303B1E|nr:potassium transporter Kup [Phenylobacterium sp.]HEX4710474.1 potassium transporter Kup [Phenylobacterium sp.]